MDKKQCLERCQNLWEDMERTGSEWKGSWPGWEKYGKMLFHCPCCEFTKKEGKLVNTISPQCFLCPLLDYWMESLGESKDNITGCPCEGIGSPYREWLIAKTPEDRSKYAKIIAGFPKAELEKMKEGEMNED